MADGAIEFNRQQDELKALQAQLAEAQRRVAELEKRHASFTLDEMLKHNAGVRANAKREGAAEAYSQIRLWLSRRHTFEDIANMLTETLAKLREPAE